MSEDPGVQIDLDREEVAFILAFLASFPPADSEAGKWSPSGAIEDWPPESYERLWRSLDNKLRSA